jgi:hypothetical protein
MALLDRILAGSVVVLSDATAELERGAISVAAWERQMEQLLARYHMAALIAGRAEQLGVKVDSALLSERRLSREERAIVKERVKEQLTYLRAFQGDIAGAEEWSRRFNARAAMYGESVKQSYWQGRTMGMGLPGYPGDGGTACLTRCGCRWEFDDTKAYWRMGAIEHCDGCVSRAARWSPYVMRSAA